VGSSESDTSVPAIPEFQTKWEFIDSGFNTGKFNMDFDLHLVERCRNENTSFLRFYRWKPYTISLGYNQNKLTGKHGIDYGACAQDNIDVVERPTGGRAVLHSEELTYSVVLISKRTTQELYRDISLALINGLKLIDPNNKELQKLSFTLETPDLPKLVKEGKYNLCFNTAIKYEINYRGKKLVGSAQRNFGDIVLQHGSILIGEHHKKIANYLNIPDESVREKINKDINEKTACLNEILKREITYEETAAALLKGFENTLNINFSVANLNERN
jgi:lipoyl(octanoyl) transferase